MCTVWNDVTLEKYAFYFQTRVIFALFCRMHTWHINSSLLLLSVGLSLASSWISWKDSSAAFISMLNVSGRKIIRIIRYKSYLMERPRSNQTLSDVNLATQHLQDMTFCRTMRKEKVGNCI
jgi:hypothetical protein